MKGLLHKTLLFYSIFTTIILLSSYPFVYWAMDNLYKEDVDEAIFQRKDEFIAYNLPSLKIEDIQQWNRFNRDIKILPDTVASKDFNHIIEQKNYDALVSEWEPYRILYTKIKIQNQTAVLMIQLNLVESEDLIATLGRFYLGILFVLLAVILMFAKFTSKYLWKSFYDTLQKIEQFNLEKHDAPTFQQSNIKEFEQLNKSLKKLITANIQSYQSQKEFIENAAHELQTPLAVFQGKIDTLLQLSDVTQKQFVILSSMNDTVSKLNRLNKNLLLLSKINTHQYNETIHFNLAELIKKPLDFFTEQAIAKNIKIKLEMDDTVMVKANLVLTEILVSNLFLNAIRHNVNKGSIHISLSNHTLVFANTGIPEPLNNDKLFTRFSKANPSSQGNGLGLAIIKTIAELNQWNVTYTFQNNLHTFSIVF